MQFHVEYKMSNSVFVIIFHKGAQLEKFFRLKITVLKPTRIDTVNITFTNTVALPYVRSTDFPTSNFDSETHFTLIFQMEVNVPEPQLPREYRHKKTLLLAQSKWKNSNLLQFCAFQSILYYT